MPSAVPLSWYLILSAILFCLGIAGFIFRRNIITVFMSIELMLNAVNLSFIAFSYQLRQVDGHIFSFFVMVVAAAEVVVGLSIIITIYRTRRSTSVDAANLLIFQLPGTNALDVAERVEKTLEERIKPALPADVDAMIPFDTTKFVSAAISNVYQTLIEAGLLVLLVILVFLQNWRALLVPATTVPVTIVGAFSFLKAPPTRGGSLTSLLPPSPPHPCRRT